MNPSHRQAFDEQLEQVLVNLPTAARDLLAQVTLYVEDYPSRRIMDELEIEHRKDLLGFYSGVALTERTLEQSPDLSDAVFLYREGIIAQAHEEVGRFDIAAVREQIRVTLLHELGHLAGLGEDDLDELGYG